jgi:hypothetical protein
VTCSKDLSPTIWQLVQVDQFFSYLASQNLE